MRLSDEQQDAFDEILEFLTGDSDKPLYTLGGLAGTGKTTLLAALCDELQQQQFGFVVGTPTGKAASVLIKKGVPAATIHSLCYLCQGKDKHGELVFDFVGIKRDEDDPPVYALIIDEASMVSQSMLNDLMCAGVKLLFVGDYGQLPPVKDDPRLMERCDRKLIQVHRQMGGLLELCYACREDRLMGKHFTADEAIARYATMGTERANTWQDEADVIIVGTNRTRFETNQHRLGQLGLRVRHGALSDERKELGPMLVELAKPVPMCVMSNSREDGLYNGEIGWFLAQKDYEGLVSGLWFMEKPPEELVAAALTDGTIIDARPVTITTKALFTKPGTVAFYEDGLKVDFGWAITCHKAQGSEWDHVAVCEELTQSDDDHRRRWRYTAATRAKRKLTWCGSIRR